MDVREPLFGNYSQTVASVGADDDVSSAPATTGCPFCGRASGHIVHPALEMMFGTRAQFDYAECPECGSIWLLDPPPSMTPFYPPGYYAFSEPEPSHAEPARCEQLRRLGLQAFLRSSILARVLLGARRDLPRWTSLLTGTDVKADAVLDVGSAIGHRLQTLRRHGFRRLTGTDEHLPGQSATDNGMGLLAAALGRLSGPFDVILFHHSLEHIEDPVGVLRTVDRLLAPGGTVVIRVPLAGSFAWRSYQSHWVQLDAPRHLFLPTPAAVELLAAEVGFAVVKVVYDSTSFQFWGSEQYQRGIPLTDPCSYQLNPAGSPFSSAEIEDFERRAERLNANHDGDQAAFALRRPGAARPAPLEHIGRPG